ncbi:MAG: hypothetical protein K9K67_12985 [Bacteriovoracaceae bacterium]|nr:hypothetical protein [Bacteriovoracaceae bacterium]
MKLKNLTTLCALSLVSLGTQARLNGFDTTSATQKADRGFEVSALELEMNDRYIKGADFSADFGREKSSFHLLLNGNVHLHKSGGEVLFKVGSMGLGLDADLSLDVYNVLAADYTPKRIAEGVAMGESVFKCSEPTACEMRDERGTFWLFDGNSTEGRGNRFSAWVHGGSKSESFNFNGDVFNSRGGFTKSFREALKKQILEVAPDTLDYFQVSSSSATNQRSYSAHREEAKEELEKDFGKTELERMVVTKIIKETKVSFEELVKRGSRSGCTYFCGTSGRFVRATVEAKTKF